MKHIFSYIALSLLSLGSLYAQEPDVEFSEVEHNMGTILWQNPATAKFTVANPGTTDMVITDVEPDCGCTLVTWTKEPIAPGKTGSISVRYDARQLGHFNKGIAVYVGENQTPTYISISGNVVNAMAASKATYDYHMGSVDLDMEAVEFDDVERGDEPFRTIEIRNSGKEKITPTLMHLPSWLAASYAPDELYPGRTGKILLTLLSDELPSMGLTQADVYLSTQPGERLKPGNDISVSVTLLPEKSDNPADLDRAPVCSLDKKEIDAREINTKAKVKDVIILENKGKTVLEVQKLQVYNPGVEVSLGSQNIKPGQRVKMKITVTKNVLQFKGRPRILLITNDPETPKVVVNVNIKK